MSTPPDTQALREKVAARLQEIEALFPGGQPVSRLEVQATTEWASAVKMLKSVFPKAMLNRCLGTNEGIAVPVRARMMGDWEFLLFAAKLLRYIALSARYEARVFDPRQRVARDERAKRHAELLERWPVIG